MLGSASRQDGRSASLTAPSGVAQQGLLHTAMVDAGVSPVDLSFAEAHGTGTALGDPIEVNSLVQVLGDGRTKPLVIGAVKTNIGHLEGAAGIAGLIKLSMVVMHGDHGYQLGEKACWTKHTNFELGTRVPLIMRAPWLPAGGARITPPVEIVDMYKTMAELAGLPAPESGVQGRSLAPLFIDATVNVWGEGEPVAFSQYAALPRPLLRPPLTPPPPLAGMTAVPWRAPPWPWLCRRWWRNAG